MLEAEQQQVERAVTARRQLIELRAKHGAATRATLSPTIVDSARLGRDAVAGLADCVAELDGVNRQLGMATGN